MTNYKMNDIIRHFPLPSDRRGIFALCANMHGPMVCRIKGDSYRFALWHFEAEHFISGMFTCYETFQERVLDEAGFASDAAPKAREIYHAIPDSQRHSVNELFNQTFNLYDNPAWNTVKPDISAKITDEDIERFISASNYTSTLDKLKDSSRDYQASSIKMMKARQTKTEPANFIYDLGQASPVESGQTYNLGQIRGKKVTTIILDETAENGTAEIISVPGLSARTPRLLSTKLCFTITDSEDKTKKAK